MKNLKVECFFGGGDPVNGNITSLKSNKPQIVVGTPGRLRDLVCDKRELKLEKLKFFILDESDTMIDDIKMRQDI